MEDTGELFRRAVQHPDIVKSRNDDYWAVCPWHADSRERPNLHINTRKRIVKCFSGSCGKGGIFYLAKAWSLYKPGEVPNGAETEKPAELKGEPKGKKLVATYYYREHHGNLVAIKGRFEAPTYNGNKPDKEFRWKLPNAEGWPGLSGKLSMLDIPLYHADDIAQSDNETAIFLVEGEKAADAITKQAELEEIKAIGTTLGGGSSQKDVNPEVLTILANRYVPVWPDNDISGRTFTTLIQRRLSEAEAQVYWVCPPRRLPPKGDAVEYFAMGGTLQELVDEGSLRAIEGSTPLSRRGEWL